MWRKLFSSSVPVSVNPTTNTTYYLRAEGTCNTTSCLIKNIIVSGYSGITSIDSVSACSGDTIMIPVSLYHSPPIGDFTLEIDYDASVLSALQLPPYNSLNNPGCHCAINNNISLSGTIIAQQSHKTTLIRKLVISWQSGTSVQLDTDNYGNAHLFDIKFKYYGNSTSLSFDNLTNSGQNCEYADSLFNALNDNPTTTYYHNGIVNQFPCSCSLKAYSVIANPSTICQGQSTTFYIYGGSLGSGANWNWYNSSCGGTFITSGTYPVLSPTITSLYFVRAESSCNTTACMSIIIAVNDTSVVPDSVSATFKILCNPQLSSDLSVNGGNLGKNADWYWYLNSCGATDFGQGAILNNVNPSISTTYWVRAEGLCNNTPCISITLIVGYDINGNFYYDNDNNRPLDLVWAYLQQNGAIIDSVQTDISGSYHFTCVPCGIYNITAKTHKPWGGVNTTDAILLAKFRINPNQYPLTSSIKLHSADVDFNDSINGIDEMKIKRRFVGSDTSFNRGDWIFEKPFGGDTIISSTDSTISSYYNDTVIVNCQTLNQNISGICVGDINSSYYPPVGAKSSIKIKLEYIDTINLNSNQFYYLPFIINDSESISSFSLIITFPKQILNIDTIISHNVHITNGLLYKLKNNDIRIGWDTLKSFCNFFKYDTLFFIKFHTNSNFTSGNIINFNIKNDDLCEFSDSAGIPIEDFTLNTYLVYYKNEVKSLNNIKEQKNFNPNSLIIYPNPANNLLNINFIVTDNSYIKISIYNAFGEEVASVVSNFLQKGKYHKTLNVLPLPSGVYSASMLSNNYNIIIKNIVIIK